jgi:hypothetical protein
LITTYRDRAEAERVQRGWSLSANEDSQQSYERGTCPNADSLFERSILIPIPSCLTERDEDDLIAAFDRVL